MTRPRLVVGALALGGLLASASTSSPQPAPLSPEEVLRSVDLSLPLIAQARRDVDAAAGELTAARGGFDLTVSAYGQRLSGEYENDRFSSLFEQPLAAWGISTYAGYRAGRGQFASYDGKAETRASGELVAGVEVPLLRGRAIDSRRAERQAADLGLARARQQLDAARLSCFSTALSYYWDWVAAGQQLEVARALLALAEARDQQLADAVALGQIAPIERTDNQRAIYQRRSALVAAQRLVEQRAIDVSLYYRAPDGTPRRPGSDRLPPLPAGLPTALPGEDDEVRTALDQRPDVAARRLRRDQQQVDLRLAENTLLPSLDFFSEVTRDGTEDNGPVKSGSAFEVGVSFKLPVQRRKAFGLTAKARAALSKAELDLTWVQDNVRADVQDALSAVKAAAGVLDAVHAEFEVARELERLERDRFDLGDSTQFLVNLRELATADAAVREARAQAGYQKALVGLDTATGRLLDRVPTP